MNHPKKPIKAVAVFHPEICNGISGTVIFTELPTKQTKKKNSSPIKIKIDIELEGVATGKHGFHIHESGNILEKCMSCKAHFNPFNEVHGGLDSQHRHVGDLGNVVANSSGKVNMTLYDTKIQLRGTKCNIIGRSLIIHEKEDDLGLTVDNPESKINGLAGARLGCAVVGYAEAYYF